MEQEDPDSRETQRGIRRIKEKTMSTSDETTIDLTDAETYIDAATKHGEDDDPDHEVGDLQTYFRKAFELLTPSQKAAFASDDEVRECLELGGVELPEMPEKPEGLSASDKIPLGTWGSLQAIDGRKIIATFEKVPGSCGITKVKRKADGSLQIQHCGESELDWDSQETVKTEDGRIQFLDEDYNIVTEDQVIVVSMNSEDDDEGDQED